MRVIVFFAVMLFCSAIAADEQNLSQCMAIENSPDRLICFEGLARQQVKKLDVKKVFSAPVQPTGEVIDKTATQVAEAEAGNSDDPPRSASRDLPDTEKRESGLLKYFGRNKKQDPAEQRIVAYIEAVKKSPLGKRIMRLSNGQVWSESEAGKLRIEAEQQVTITKRRWRYAMRLGNDRVITVKRIDD